MDWIDAEILQVVDETPRDRSLVLGLAPEALAAFRPRPGQHVFLEAVGEDAPGRGAYSISALPSATDHLQVTVRDHGELGHYFYGRTAGARLRVSEPRGRFVLAAEEGQATLLFGRGPSVAPYRAFVRALREAHHADPVTVVHEAEADDELLFRDELERHAGELGWLTYLRRVAAPVDAELFPTLASEGAPRVFVCGENAFVDRIQALAREAGLPDELVLREKWG